MNILMKKMHQFSSVTQSCLILCDPMDCSMPGFPVYHQLPELTQTHVHGVSDAIQPFHPLLSPPPAFSLSQHQGLFQWVSFLHQVATVLELQHQSFHEYSGLISFRIVYGKRHRASMPKPHPFGGFFGDFITYV